MKAMKAVNKNKYKEDIKIIEEFSTRDILLAVLKVMNKDRDIIQDTRCELKSMWYDNIWGPKKPMQCMIPVIFERTLTKGCCEDVSHKWADWSMVFDRFKCRLCGKTVEMVSSCTYKPDFDGELIGHMRECRKVRAILKASNSLKNFKNNIRKAVK